MCVMLAPGWEEIYTPDTDLTLTPDTDTHLSNSSSPHLTHLAHLVKTHLLAILVQCGKRIPTNFHCHFIFPFPSWRA